MEQSRHHQLSDVSAAFPGDVLFICKACLGLPLACSTAQVISAERFTYQTRGKGLMFRRKQQVDVFRLTPQRLMRG